MNSLYTTQPLHPISPLTITIALRRGYVVAVKDDKEPDDPGKTIFSIGTRFAVDLGKRRLMRAYFATIGQDMDPALLKEFLEEEQAEEKARKDGDEVAGEGEAEQE
jgi:hypothetical protein